MDSGQMSDDSLDLGMDEDPPISFIRSSAADFPLGDEIDVWASGAKISKIVVAVDKYEIPEPISAPTTQDFTMDTDLPVVQTPTDATPLQADLVPSEDILAHLSASKSPSPRAMSPSSPTYYPSPLSDDPMPFADFQGEGGTADRVSESAISDLSEDMQADGNSSPIETPNKRRRLDKPARHSPSSSILSSPPADPDDAPAERKRKHPKPPTGILHSAMMGPRRLRPFGVSLPPILCDTTAYEFEIPNFLSAVAAYECQGGFHRRSRPLDAWGIPLPDEVRSTKYAPKEFRLPADIMRPAAPAPAPAPAPPPVVLPQQPKQLPRPRIPGVGPVLINSFRLGPPSGTESVIAPTPMLFAHDRLWIPYTPPTYGAAGSTPSGSGITQNPVHPSNALPPLRLPTHPPISKALAPVRWNPLVTYKPGVALSSHRSRGGDDDAEAPEFTTMRKRPPQTAIRPGGTPSASTSASPLTPATNAEARELTLPVRKRPLPPPVRPRAAPRAPASTPALVLAVLPHRSNSARAHRSLYSAFGVALPPHLLRPHSAPQTEYQIPNFLEAIASFEMRVVPGAGGERRHVRTRITDAFGVSLPELLLKFQETPAVFQLPDEVFVTGELPARVLVAGEPVFEEEEEEEEEEED
ncbi:hypothetical protein B0H16DRAFT_1572518 [Mycena metata]|uniref:Uncharacterized protein n=1 Tax=Mycena metata TaxID=1033252 RepID=A0AAD7MXX5_9AGAR|nr:hypothetical protein B0H16DRAFT_1572518 [Mycena metata]